MYSYINFDTFKITYNNINNINNIQYYLIIDTKDYDAFGHWVFESAIYIPFYIKLKEIYPNIKIHLKSKKKFKDIFLN